MRTRCVLAALLLLIPFVAAAETPRQHLKIDFDPIERTLRGHLEITLTPGSDTIYFGLLPNFGREPNPNLAPRILDGTYPFGFEPSSLDVESVTLVQSPSQTALAYRLLSLPPSLQTYSLEETVLAVDLPAGVEAATVRIDFSTEAPRTTAGDDGVTDGVLTWRFGWYPMLLANQAEIVEADGAIVYGEDAPLPFVLPFSIVDATISAPAGFGLLTGADTVSITEDEETARYEVAFEGSTRSFAIALGEDYETYVLEGETRITVAFFDGFEEEARLYATYARDILATYEERFGPYPRAGLTIVQSPRRGNSAFAADGILWLSGAYFTHRDIPVAGILNRFAEYVLAHEIAHQWFGLGVDLDTDAWLSEGLANYASITYFEDRFGPTGGNVFRLVTPGLLEDLVDSQFGFYNLREHQVELPYVLGLWSAFDEAIVKPMRDVEYANQNAVRLYDKGYLVARSIASTIGEEAFDVALAAAFGADRDRRMTAAGFQEVLEEIAGATLDEVFEAWVYGEATVDYTVEILSMRPVDVGYETTVAVTRTGGAAQPVEVEALLVSEATTRETWDAVETAGTLVFHTPSPVVRVTIDPDHRLPDRNRLNNNDPVKFVTAINRVELPLDAYVITPDTTSGGFTFSWLDRFRITVQGNSASMIVNEGRNHRYSGSVSVADGTLTGELAYTFTRYAPVETGSPATYWAPDIALSGALLRLYDTEAEEAFWALRLSAIDLPSIAATSISAASIDLAEGGGSRLTVRAFDEIRLLPNFYLQGSGVLGFGVGDLPAPLRFTFDELPAMTMTPSLGKLVGTLSVTLDAEEEPFNLLNLAIVEGRRTRLFLAGGIGWTSLRECCTTSPSVEAGIEQTLRLATLGGLLPFEVRLSISTPVKGAGATVFTFGLSL